MLQLPPADRDPPENEIVRGAVEVKVPPQAAVVAFGTVKPKGIVSVNPTPVRALPTFGLTMAKVNALVFPLVIDKGEKTLERLGGFTRGQPRIMISSRYTPEVVLLAPTALILKVLVFVPVVAALMEPEAYQFPLEAPMVVRVVKAPPSAFE